MKQPDPADLKEFSIEPSTIETIDTAMFKWLDQSMNLFATTNKGWKKVPVIWVLGERSHQVKENPELRDNLGTFILPVISIERTNIQKDLNRKGVIWSALPEALGARGGAIEIGQRIKQDKTTNFLAVENKKSVGQYYYPTKKRKTVYQSVSIPLPVYVICNYTIELKTEYQQQMNELLQPFLTVPGGVNRIIISENEHRYEGFLQSDFNVENNVSNMEENERSYSTKIEVEVLGYLIGQDKNQAKPKVVLRENIVDIKITRERVITEKEYNSKDKKVF